jgi:hypothetical protein
MCFDASEAAEVWRETPRKARRWHRCDECGTRIPAGVRYVECSGIGDGTPFRLHVHAECLSLWERVRDALCGGKGAIMIGGLDEELRNGEARETWPYRMRLAAIRKRYEATS